jgi:hypothetical protein
VLRSALLDHRSIHGPGSNKGNTRLIDAYFLYVAELKKGMASQAIPAGTALGRISDVKLALGDVCRTREFQVRDLVDKPHEA